MTERKNKRLWIRLSDEEYKLLQRNAVSQDCTMSELIRRTAIYGQKISPVVLDMKPIKKMLYELQMQGNNLNQLAREANTFGVSKSLAKSIEEEISKSEKMLDKLDQLLDDIREGRLNLDQNKTNQFLSIYFCITIQYNKNIIQ